MAKAGAILVLRDATALESISRAMRAPGSTALSDELIETHQSQRR